MLNTEHPDMDGNRTHSFVKSTIIVMHVSILFSVIDEEQTDSCLFTPYQNVFF